MAKIKSPASALGEAVGHLVEEVIRESVTKIATSYGLEVGKNQKIPDKVGVSFEIDMPIFKGRKLIALIDAKYIRYKKHARDKGSWVVVAHSRLRHSYPEIRRTLAILIGPAWTEGAKKMISTSCIDVIHVKPELLDIVLSKFGIRFKWNEKNTETPKISWEKFQRLSGDEIRKIKELIAKESAIEEKLKWWFKRYVLGEDPEEKIRLPYICPEAEGTR
jgi:hypothetical protein